MFVLFIQIDTQAGKMHTMNEKFGDTARDEAEYSIYNFGFIVWPASESLCKQSMN